MIVTWHREHLRERVSIARAAYVRRSLRYQDLPTLLSNRSEQPTGAHPCVADAMRADYTRTVTIGQDFRHRRQAAGCGRCQNEFAAKIAPPLSRASSLERQEVTADHSTRLKLAKALTCPLGKLIRGYGLLYDAVVRDLPRHAVAAQSETAIHEAAGATVASRALDRHRDLSVANGADTAIEQLVRLSAEPRRKGQAPGATARRGGRRHRAPH